MIGKVLGGAFVLLGCSGIGFYTVIKNAVRIRMLKEFEQDLQYIYGEIEYAAPDMAEIMERLSFRRGAFAVFFSRMQERILSHQGMRLCEYWKEEMENIRGIENLNFSDREFFMQVGENLGNMDRMTQLRTLGLFQKRLSEILRKAESEYYGKAKISLVIGITGGFFLVILLF
ncbi:MAG: stage III sporulation protein AB [Lachnospiraceae bacterium]|nr:stage III sporulation protein AB [Lachnospiraceae bacterium]